MPTIPTFQLIEEVQTDFDKGLSFIKENIEGMPIEKLAWRPDKKSWSILECLEHLNLVGKHYIPLMEKGILNTNTRKNKAKKEFNTGFLGHKFTSSMRPKEDGTLSSRSGTFKSVNPSKTKTANDKTIKAFIVQQVRYKALLDKAAKIDLEAVRVKSLLGGIVKFKLGDAFRFIVAHNDRHLLQIKNILEHEKFPK